MSGTGILSRLFGGKKHAATAAQEMEQDAPGDDPVVDAAFEPEHEAEGEGLAPDPAPEPAPEPVAIPFEVPDESAAQAPEVLPVPLSQFEALNQLPLITMAAHVRTEAGDVPARALRLRDKVLTRDNGYQQVRWIGRQKFRPKHFPEGEKLSLIAIAPDTLGASMPNESLIVGPSQSLLLESPGKAGEPSQVLVQAIDLIDLDGVETVESNTAGLIQILLDQHEMIMVNGAWVGSFVADGPLDAAFPPDMRLSLATALTEMAERADQGPEKLAS